jgi:hypothetical protein
LVLFLQTKGGYAGVYGQQSSFDSVDSFSQLKSSADNEPPESMPVKLGMIYVSTYPSVFMTNILCSGGWFEKIADWRSS